MAEVRSQSPRGGNATVLRGEVYWVDAPGGPRPAVVVSADRYNQARINTVVVATITHTPANGRPGRVSIDFNGSEKAVNTNGIYTILKSDLREYIARLDLIEMETVDFELNRSLFN